MRLHTADTIGAWIAACGTAEGRALLAFRKDADALADRVAINVALARLSEIDDIHLAAMITPGAIVVPAALTIAASLPDVAADDLAAAIVAGYEAMIRLGAAIDGPSVLYRGIWPTYFAAPFGAAAVAARLLRLDDKQAANALSAALIMAAPGTGHHAAPTTVRWLAVGHAAGRGLQAALAAGAGFTSDVKIADGDFLKNIFGIAPNAALLGGGSGGLALEPDLVQALVRGAPDHGGDAGAEGNPGGWRRRRNPSLRIGVAVLPPHVKMIDHGVTAGDRFSHLTSVQYQMAVAALDAGAGLWLERAGGADLAGAVGLHGAHPGSGGGGAARRRRLSAGWPAHVTVTASGRRERTVTHVPGDPARPFGEADLKAKFVRVTAACSTASVPRRSSRRH